MPESASDGPCAAHMVCSWKTGKNACVDFDVEQYPPVVSPRCILDSRRKQAAVQSAPLVLSTDDSDGAADGGGGGDGDGDDGDGDEEGCEEDLEFRRELDEEELERLYDGSVDPSADKGECASIAAELQAEREEEAAELAVEAADVAEAEAATEEDMFEAGLDAEFAGQDDPDHLGGGDM